MYQYPKEFTISQVHVLKSQPSFLWVLVWGFFFGVGFGVGFGGGGDDWILFFFFL